MAGKSNKGRSKKGSHNASNSSEPLVQSDVAAKDNVEGSSDSAAGDSTNANPEVKERETANEGSQPKQGEPA